MFEKNNVRPGSSRLEGSVDLFHHTPLEIAKAIGKKYDFESSFCSRKDRKKVLNELVTEFGIRYSYSISQQNQRPVGSKVGRF